MKTDKKTVVHFWVPYPEGVAPSQRFRVELFFPLLRRNDIHFEMYSFLDQKAWDILYKKGSAIQKALGTLNGYFRRVGHLYKAMTADYVFIHREATPIGPPVFEWLLAKLLRKKIIHEYDDAIWIPGGEKISFIKKWLKATWKIKYIIRWSYKVVGGNDFLCAYALRYNPSVICIPTVVDTDNGHHIMRNQYEGEKVVVGWTGSHTTLHNLEEIEEVLAELKKEGACDILVISNVPPAWGFDFIFKKWNAETELEDLLGMHIGVMPLKKGPWFEGKCGFKLIQYLACGIPAVASPVGVNPRILNQETCGFIANNKEEWKNNLLKLIQDPELRTAMGKKGREYIESAYSLRSASFLFLELFS
ncbi:MAG: glycosyltransferase [Terrimonas sp.]|nr:glycosyltransferase [Terrimonas sp.]